MKLFLILLCTVTCRYCMGYPVDDGEMEEILIGSDASVEYSLETFNDSSSNDSLIRHGVFKKVGSGIKNKVGFNDNTGSGKTIGGGRHIGGGIGTRPGSGGGKDAEWENAKWAMIGTGIILIVATVGLAWYYWQTRKKKWTTVNQVDATRSNQFQ